ncbi:hypothetical protein FYJ34_11385 [Clostridiaceae bacterium 68-1-5]|uniref:Uncharacterized protein n=1 Tax=Suipraeoptans intestinalis TaxID=2606628 RepID=A0A6N7UTG4_9FIRM|nr:hypothetical protein [Suipraeoptans intestinalis]MSR94843.1 hypothetical protein [Suipraeoptans intestinalis]
MTDADLKAAYTPAGTAAGYTPTPEDAKKLHYVSRTVEASKIATVEDHTSPALWDYVYDPEASTIVLGQRAKMIYHSNHSSATMEGERQIQTRQDRSWSRCTPFTNPATERRRYP